MPKHLTIAILDFDHIHNPLLGAGQATATYGVGRELVKLGHKVIVYCSKYPGYKDSVIDGIEYRHTGIGTQNIRLNNFWYVLSNPFRVKQIRHADLIIECFTAPVSTMFSPLFTKIPVVALPSMFNAAEFTRKYKLPFHLVESFGLKFYKYLMPYSHIDSAKAKRLNPSIQMKIIGQGVDRHYFSLKPIQKPKHILYLGRFDIDQKGIDLLLEAYALVKNKISYPLVIAGHGPDEVRIKQLIKDLKLQSKVKMVGSAYGPKKDILMTQAAFVAFPSRHDEMCLWTLEALAGGLPMVAFDLPESEWLPSTVALKVARFDIQAYADALLAISQPKTLTKMRKASRAFAHNFSWTEVAQAFVSFFYQIIKQEKVAHAR